MTLTGNNKIVFTRNQIICIYKSCFIYVLRTVCHIFVPFHGLLTQATFFGGCLCFPFFVFVACVTSETKKKGKH
jgi:hypothetical protein